MFYWKLQILFFLLEYSKHEEIELIEDRMEVLVTKIILELGRAMGSVR